VSRTARDSPGERWCPVSALDDKSTHVLAATGPARLEVKDLRVELQRSGADVVSDVSFSVHSTEVLGLVGESGSGKTTVALALLGHTRRGLDISKGEVRLDGENLLDLKAKELREVRGAKVAYVPQDPAAALDPTLRVGFQLREALRVHPGCVDDVEARVTEVLREARLDSTPEMLKRYPHQLSGGQQQRVTIAMAFACRPSLIVLDEPTTGLDVSTQRHVLETVRSMCRSYGVAAVYVSHDLAVVGGLVSQVAVMYAGRVVEIGPTQQVFPFPVHPYTRGLLAAVPSLERAEVLTGIEGQPPRPGHRPKGCAFAPRCSYALPSCSVETPVPVSIGDRYVRCIRARDIEKGSSAGRPGLPTPIARTGDSLLKVRSLDASYGHEPVLFNVDLDVQRESCLAIVGESGSGKTTLARCIVGLHSNWTGEVTFRGNPLARGARDRQKELLKQVQYIFQNPYTSLNPRKTIGQILSEPLDHFFRIPADGRRARVFRVLEDVSLAPDFVGRYPDQLSGGERQRVAIARAIIVEPDLLLCDEVTSALDVSVQALTVEVLRRLQSDRRLTVVFITHNLALVRSIAQTAVVLCNGRVVEMGPVEQVLEHPKDPYTVRLIEDVPKLAEVGTGGGAGPTPT
jgi:peptide/nickel transport system ATP-binding protein